MQTADNQTIVSANQQLGPTLHRIITTYYQTAEVSPLDFNALIWAAEQHYLTHYPNDLGVPDPQ